MTPKYLRTFFVCQNCGFQTGKWLGKCPECEAWSSFLEEVPDPGTCLPRTPGPAGTGRQPAAPLISLSSVQEERRPCGCVEFDRALGGGLVLGSVVLLGGDPGIGKSTLMLQVLDRLCGNNYTGLYVSGEESAAQIKLRADRLGITSPTLLVATETCLENILKLVETDQTALPGPGLHPNLICRQPAGRARFRHPGPGNGLSVGAMGETHQCPRLSHRPRHQGRRHCRTETPGAHGGYGALF